VYLRQSAGFLPLDAAKPVGCSPSTLTRARRVDLTPGERSVLLQIRVLYYNAAKREQQLRALLALWTPTHYETYKAAFAGLVAKQLISENGSQLFRITDAGLKAMGIAVPQPAKGQVPAASTQPSKPVTGIRGALSRLGFLRPRV
jgi:hypothetical protein